MERKIWFNGSGFIGRNERFVIVDGVFGNNRRHDLMSKS